MIIEMKKLASSVTIAPKSIDLFTRYIGKLLFQKIKEKLAYIKPHEVVILNFAGIRSVDASFVDECIVQLITLSQEWDIPFYIKLANITDNVEYIVKQVIELQKEQRRYVIMTDRLCNNGCHAIGILSDIEKDIIEFCVIHKKATSVDIASFLHISEQEAEQLLTNLYSMRVIRKLDEYSIYCLV